MKETDYEDKVDRIIKYLHHHPVIMEYIISEVEKDKDKVEVINSTSYLKYLKAFKPSFLYMFIMLSTNFLSFINSDLISIMSNTFLFSVASLWQFANCMNIVDSNSERLKVGDVDFELISLSELSKRISSEEFEFFITILKNKYFRNSIYNNIMSYKNNKPNIKWQKAIKNEIFEIQKEEENRLLYLNEQLINSEKRKGLILSIKEEQKKVLI